MQFASVGSDRSRNIQTNKLNDFQVSYVECHATATLLGDGIEISGLADAFAATSGQVNASTSQVTLSSTSSSQIKPWCALGSIKGNIAHANCAAGITGLIKALLCLHHKELVPTAHFEKVNPKLGLE